MMFNPVIASKNIKDEFISYISTTFSFADKKLRDQFIRELQNTIAKGPYLETNDVFKSGKSIEQLIEEGVLSSLFRDLESSKPYGHLYKRILPINRPLYLHQERAIRSIVSGNNAVISTGTGSGKTNCFLIPVINELLREKENGTLGPGIRALFIYPMNALANDQMKNIRKLLMYYPDITFGMYTGATVYEEKEAIAVYKSMYASEELEELKKPLKNELLSREEMKNTPPNILFTNYAMLEHLLFRPKDDVLFSNSDFKFVVLDEAHIYSGATGIETAILLRRLRARIHSSKSTQFILTSATLGTDNNGDDDIVEFAKNLCGVEFSKQNIIKSDREKYVPQNNFKKYPDELYIKLANDQNNVKNILKDYGIVFDEKKEDDELLYDFIINTDLYNIFRREINGIAKVKDIENILIKDDATTTAFISICTRAQKNGKALIDARYHFFVRCLEGCFIALGPEKNIFLNRKRKSYINNKEYAVFEIALCDDCGRLALVGKIQDGYFEQANKLEDDVNYYFLADDANVEFEDEDFEEENSNSFNFETYNLCVHCGKILNGNDNNQITEDCSHSNTIKIYKAKKISSGSKCGNCHKGVYKRFYLGNDASTAVLATSLYEQLPEKVDNYNQVTKITNKNIFSRAMSVSKTKKSAVRQFLAFSDGRQEAAKFACYLSKSYAEFIRRRGISQIINRHRDEIIEFGGITISDFVKKLTSYFATERSFAESYSDIGNLQVVSNKNAWVAVLNELVRYNSTTSLTSLGVIKFEYLGNSPEVVETISQEYGISNESAKTLLDLLINEIILHGAISTDNDSDIDDNDREYIFYTSLQKFVTLYKEKNSILLNWLPKNKKGSSNKYYKTRRMHYVKKFLNIDDEKANEFLHNYFEYLCDYDNPYHLIDKTGNNDYTLPAKNIKIRVAGESGVKWYICSKCGKISPYNINGKCISIGCNSIVEEINPVQIQENNHFARLYFSNKMSPLFIKEHTAQLSKTESALYQEQFIKKDINALSCSTTFEMGVDVGDLETVFLRDVPPLPSNYAQRAGRAGRSLNAAAYALTYAKLSSHDLSYFNEPEKMIKGTIYPPLFKVDNEKIVKRHIYAVALSMFFANNPDLYNGNKADKFINEKKYELFIDWIKTKPKELEELLISSIPNIDNLHERLKINSFGWIDDFCGEDGVFTALINEYERNITEFKKLIEEYKNSNEIAKAAACQSKLKNYMNNKLIDFLARGNILPRYGFPVDTVELEQNVTASNIKKLRLSRDLQIAIAEYAPSSEVVADGKLYTSRYIKKSFSNNKDHEWYTAYIAECSDARCGSLNYSITPVNDDEVNCISCGKKIDAKSFNESIEPRSGFVTDRTEKEVPLTKQEKNYKSIEYYIGNKESKIINKYKFKYNNTSVTLESTTNDSLLVRSLNFFYVCPKCGFAYSCDEIISKDKKASEGMKRKHLYIETEEKHESLYGKYKCECTKLNKFYLHHTFNTDVVKISFDCDTSDKYTMYSVMYAILHAISSELNIERKDIKACLSSKIIHGEINYSIIIYDSVPGGAGHSRRLVTDDGKIFQKIINAAVNNMKNCNCDPSCYNCLRNYENQRIHDNLDRRLAYNFLKKLLGEAEVLEY